MRPNIDEAERMSSRSHHPHRAALLGVLATLAIAGCQDPSDPVPEATSPNTRLNHASECKEAFASLDVPGSTTTSPLGINDLGQVSGRFADASGNTHGFVRDPDGTFHQIDVPGAAFTAALAINNWGTVAGRYDNGDGVSHGFRLFHGRFETVDYPGAPNTRVRGLDNLGDITGDWYQGDQEHGYVRDWRGFHAVDFPGGATTDVWASDDQGHFVGDWSSTDGNVHAFVESNGRFTSFDAPGTYWATAARSMTHSGVIAGQLGDGDVDHGFIKTGSHYRVIDYPGAYSTDINRMNNLGVVVGNYDQDDWVDHGFILTTCPAQGTGH